MPQTAAMSELSELLRGIEPVPDQVDRCVNDAFNSFPIRESVLSHWDDYARCVGEFFSHVEGGVLGLPATGGRDVRVSFDRCLVLLRRKYGDSAIQAPFECARTGNEGGLRGVFQTIAQLMSREHAQSRIGVAVSLYCNRQPPQALIDAGKEYVRTYGHLLPSEITEGSAARVLANLPKVLREHPFMMRRFRQVGR